MGLFSGLAGVGDYTATIPILALPAELLRRWLPPELELAPQTLTAPGTHPVLLLLGQERSVHVNIAPWFRIRYGEFATVMPFVQWRTPPTSYRGPYLWTPLLYLDRWLPILAGRWLYGFAKAKAVITSSADSYRVNDAETRRVLLDAQTGPSGAAPNPAEFATLATLLQQPSLSQRDGAFICSTFDWNLPQAELSTSSADVQINQFYMYGLPNGAVENYHVSGLSDLTNGGAFHIRTTWTLSAPEPCTTFGQEGLGIRQEGLGVG